MTLKKIIFGLFTSYLAFTMPSYAYDYSYSLQKHKHHRAHHYKHHKHYYKDVYYKDFAPQRNHYEIIGGWGLAKLKVNNASMGVTSTETDSLVQTNANSWSTLAAQLGAGYVYYFDRANRRTVWFPSIEPQLNLYYLGSNSIEGDVWRYGSPNWKQMTFDVPLQSLRLMLDVALTVVTVDQLSLYGKAGIGNAWNRVSYGDSANLNDCTSLQPVNLNARTNSNFAWEVGAGLSYPIGDRVDLSFEYLYSHLGRLRLANSGNTGNIIAPMISGPTFNNLRTQTALLGLHLAL